MKKRFVQYINALSVSSSTLLFICVPLILAVLLASAASFACELLYDPVYACLVYPEYFEHILMSLALAIGGAVLFDINDKY